MSGFDRKAALDSTFGVLGCFGLIALIVGISWIVARYDWKGLAGIVVVFAVIWLWVTNYEEHKRLNRVRADAAALTEQPRTSEGSDV